MFSAKAEEVLPINIHCHKQVKKSKYIPNFRNSGFQNGTIISDVHIVCMVKVRVHKIVNAEIASRAGYQARYIADVRLQSPIATVGVIQVEIKRGRKTSPHTHEHLEELFIPLGRTKMGVGESIIELERGDVVIAEPGEKHWFETYPDEDVMVIALKLPNLKDDKIQ